MSDFTVHKLDENGRFVLSYPATLLERSNNHVKLEAFFGRDDMDLGYTTFKRGDRFVEYFYTDRWYNVFAIYDRDDGAFKGVVLQYLQAECGGGNGPFPAKTSPSTSGSPPKGTPPFSTKTNSRSSTFLSKKNLQHNQRLNFS